MSVVISRNVGSDVVDHEKHVKILLGTVLKDGKCIDINECYRETHNCRGNTECENMYDGFKCIQCPPGMEKK